jgi:replicative DNA helicase
MNGVKEQTHSLSGILEESDARLRSAADTLPKVWPTGFATLDRSMGGGLRGGGLALLAGPQGVGKSTFALQITRNVVRAGKSAVYFSFEHDPEDLLAKLIAMEAGERLGVQAPALEQFRAAFEDVSVSSSLEERLDKLPGGPDALAAVRTYADRLHIHRSTGTSTDLTEIQDAAELVWQATDHVPMLVVDYLQKVKVANPNVSDDERAGSVAEGLKDLSIDGNMPVLAVVASDREGIEAGKRMRVQHLRGSSSLAYEADAVMIFNHKYDVVARHHLVYDVSNAEKFHHWAVLTVEKNRFGQDGINLEFRKHFNQSRFSPDGNTVTEQLVDERLFSA